MYNEYVIDNDGSTTAATNATEIIHQIFPELSLLIPVKSEREKTVTRQEKMAQIVGKDRDGDSQMSNNERASQLIKKFMEAQPEIKEISVREMLVVTTHCASDLSLDEQARIYARESELFDYLDKLGINTPIHLQIVKDA